MSPFDKEDIGEGELTHYKLYHGSILPGEEISMTYLSHAQGRVSSDALFRHTLKRGNKVTIRISNMPLKVVVGKDLIDKKDP